MYLQKSLLILFAPISLTVALPGYTSEVPETTSGYSYPPPPPPKEICSAIYDTITQTGETTSTIVTTKTVYIPITTVDERPTTIMVPYPVTSIGSSTTTVIQCETALETTSYPVTTIVYSTVVETVVVSSTVVETVPYSIVVTSYKTDVETQPVTYVTSGASTSLCTELETIPFTSTIIETKTACATNGYGGGH